jgi:ATP-dependent DNA helicase RecQ
VEPARIAKAVLLIDEAQDMDGEAVFVSTMHKAKGREFDHVFILLENFDLITDEKKRLLYVAMTRAKQNLTIHLNAPFLDDLPVQGMERMDNHEQQFPPPGSAGLAVNP